MSLAEVSIKRPTFITCVILVMLAVGTLAMKRLGVDLFPNVTFPFVMVTTVYPGAGPAEIETLVSKPLEDQMSTISGIKRITSKNMEGVSQVFIEFTMETDVKYAENQVRDRVSAAKRLFPTDVEDSIIRRLDPADQPILILSVKADLPEAKLFDVADDFIRPRLEQVAKVGVVEVMGGRKREIHVNLDRAKLKAHELSVTSVATRVGAAGENVPVGKIDQGKKETVFRALGEFRNLDDIRHTIVNFFGSDIPTTLSDLGTVTDSLEDEKSRTFVNGKKSLFVFAYRQSGANTVEVADALKKRVAKLNSEMQNLPGKPEIELIRDAARPIRANLEDVQESILIGIALAVVVVFFFLGSGRSTIITGLALPNSLIGAFILMSAAGFTVNIMTLLALSLSVGLLIDDAIVVRENIFRHIELGKDSFKAAREGTSEVALAVIATTMTVIAVFGPVGFLKGIVGQFFREFGLTICFAMAISLFDALTVAPMLSAYFAGSLHEKRTDTLWARTIGRPLRAFDRFQTWLENKYEWILRYTLRHPFIVMGVSTVIFFACVASLKGVPKTFLPAQDNGEFVISFDLPPGTNLDAMAEVGQKADQVVRANKEVEVSALTIGGRNGESNVAEIYVRLVDAKDRKMNTSQFKDKVREELAQFTEANPKVKDYDAFGSGQRPFNLVLLGSDQKVLEEYSNKVLAYAKKHPALKDVDTDFRPGKPEFQVAPLIDRTKALGISTKLMGQELRAQIEGVTPAKLRESGREYDVRVRLLEDQRDLKRDFAKTYVPNMNFNLVRLPDVAQPVQTEGPATINRQDRSRYITISSDITPGKGMGDAMSDLEKVLSQGELKLPQGLRYAFIGQAESFQELGENMALAMGFGILFIFLVLASLYESFITPFTIMLALPLAVCGSFVALAVARESFNIFSMIGIIMLLGVATKNSILLVDYANQQMLAGMDRAESIILAGKTRLRPILMTTMALIAGTLPVALGLNEASRQRTSMGVAIVGGLISSTLLTLVVVPAAFSFIDRFKVWFRAHLSRIFIGKTALAEVASEAAVGAVAAGHAELAPIPTDFTAMKGDPAPAPETIE